MYVYYFSNDRVNTSGYVDKVMFIHNIVYTYYGVINQCALSV